MSEEIKQRQPTLSLNANQAATLTAPLLGEYELVESTDKQMHFSPSLPSSRTGNTTIISCMTYYQKHARVSKVKAVIGAPPFVVTG